MGISPDEFETQVMEILTRIEAKLDAIYAIVSKIGAEEAEQIEEGHGFGRTG